MKKQILLLAAVALFVAACGGSQNKANNQSQTEAPRNVVAVYELDNLLKAAEGLVNDTVTVKGVVSHTCSHSGKRCFIVAEGSDVSMRVEAKGDIGGFNRELIGSELAINGVLKERRLTREYIDEMEKTVNEKEDGSAESCDAEKNNILAMRQWMKDNDKEFYSLYYMDGLSYEVVEE